MADTGVERRQTTTESRLAHVPVTLFAITMGLAGLALAWLKGHQVLGAPLWVGLAVSGLAAIVYVVIAALYVTKAVRHRAAFLSELRHPIRIAFVPTITIGMLLVATAAADIAPALASVLWWLGAAGQLAATLAVLGAWIGRKDFSLHHVTPAWFIPVVGNLVVPLAGSRVGNMAIAEFFFAFGLVFWLALLPLVMHRLLVHEAPVPLKLLPTLAILIAPPSVAYLSLLRLDPALGAGLFGHILWGTGVFFAMLVATQLKWLRAVPFALPWWAYSFPLAALTVAVIARTGIDGSPIGLVIASWSLLIVVTALIGWLIVLTIRAITRREICVPE